MKHYFVIALVVLAILLTGCSSVSPAPSASQAAAATSDQAVASLGSITVTATGAGSLIAMNQTDLSFNQSGTLVELEVQEGDDVAAGTVLARLQVDLSAAELEAQRSAAELAVLQAQKAVADLVSNAELESAQALLRLETAQHALEDAEDPTSAQAQARQAVAEAKSSVEEAEMQVYIANSVAGSDDQYTAYAALLFKQKALAEIEKQVSRLENQIKSAGDKNLRDRLKHQMLELQVRLTNQQLVVNAAQAKLDAMAEPVDPEEIILAQTRLETAQARLRDAERGLEQLLKGEENGAQSGSIAIARAELNEAQAAWDQLQNGPDPAALALAQAELKEAQARLAQVQQSQLILELETPIGGKVLAIEYEVGDRIAARQTVLTVGDMEHPGLEVYLGEEDLNLAQVGAEAIIALDVLPDIPLSGVVTQVDPALTTSFNTKTGRLLIQIDDLSAVENHWLPVGLNATVEVIGGQVENAVLVPTEALQETPDGGYAVYLVQEDGQVISQPVTIGLMDATRVEIQSGLEAGQTVVLGNPEVSGPVASNPEVGTPEVGNPGMVDPGMDEAGVGNPPASNPGVGGPGVGGPGEGGPEVGSPGTGDPGVGGPEVGGED